MPTQIKIDPDTVFKTQVGTGCNQEVVILTMPAPITILMFTPLEARLLAARIWELADKVDGGKGLS